MGRRHRRFARCSNIQNNIENTIHIIFNSSLRCFDCIGLSHRGPVVRTRLRFAFALERFSPVLQPKAGAFWELHTGGALVGPPMAWSCFRRQFLGFEFLRGT